MASLAIKTSFIIANILPSNLTDTGFVKDVGRGSVPGAVLCINILYPSDNCSTESTRSRVVGSSGRAGRSNKKYLFGCNHDGIAGSMVVIDKENSEVVSTMVTSAVGYPFLGLNR